MGTVTTLSNVIKEIESYDAEDTIYLAKPWTKDSKASVFPEPENGNLPDEALKDGLDYFLEVFVARDFITDWKSGLKKQPNLLETCNRLIQYAINDA